MRRCSSAGCLNTSQEGFWCKAHIAGTVKIPLSWVVPEKRQMVLEGQKRFDRILAKLVTEESN